MEKVNLGGGGYSTAFKYKKIFCLKMNYELVYKKLIECLTQYEFRFKFIHVIQCHAVNNNGVDCNIKCI